MVKMNIVEMTLNETIRKARLLEKRVELLEKENKMFREIFSMIADHIGNHHVAIRNLENKKFFWSNWFRAVKTQKLP